MNIICPNCGSGMTFDHQDTHTAPNGITYDRFVYHCPSEDDYWVTVESPR